MFTPTQSLRKFDRNIFNGEGQITTIHATEPIELLYYFRGNNIVGRIEGIVETFIYFKYRRGDYLPVQIFHNGLDYCGWINANKIELAPN